MFSVVLLVMFAGGERWCRHRQSDRSRERVNQELLHSDLLILILILILILVDAKSFYHPAPENAAGILP